MNQMAMMAQMASSMGMMNGAPAQFGFPGVIPGDMGMIQGAGMNNGFQGSMMGGNGSGVNNGGRGRGGSRGGRGVGRGRGGSSAPPASAKSPDVTTTRDTTATPQSSPIIITEPTPTIPVSTPFTSASLPRTGFVFPDRPQSPTLCKFGLKCTNAHCRYAHPSPVATAESGVVLSNEACEKGKDCQDKDCLKSHVSPAVLNPQGLYHIFLVSNANSYDSSARPISASHGCLHKFPQFTRPLSLWCSLYTPGLLVHASSPIIWQLRPEQPFCTAVQVWGWLYTCGMSVSTP